MCVRGEGVCVCRVCVRGEGVCVCRVCVRGEGVCVCEVRGGLGISDSIMHR